MHRRPHIALGDVDDEIGLGRLLVRVVDTGEALDLAIACLGIDATPVRLLGELERRRHMHEVEATVLLDELAGRLSAVLEGRDGRGDDDGAGLCEFRGDEGDAADVAVAVFAGEAEFGGELGADGFAEEQRDGAAALLVERYVEGAGDGVLPRVLVAG